MKNFGTINVGQLVVKVLLASVEESDGHLAESDEGSHDPQGGRIFLHDKWLKGADARRAKETLVHELIHAWLEASGVRHKLRTMLGASDDRWDQVEEEIVCMLAPIVSSSWASASKVFSLANIKRVLGGVK